MLYAGLDLGQAADPTALIIAEQLGQRPHSYDVRHIERPPLGTPYPAIVAAVADRMARIPGTPLVVDGTGVGRAVVGLFRQVKGLALVSVLITAGDTVTKDEAGYWRVPKRDLVGVIQVLLQSSRLRIADALPETRTLLNELVTFKATITAAGHDTYAGADWRSGAHDDLVLSLALCLWYAERQAKHAAPIVPPSGDWRPAPWNW